MSTDIISQAAHWAWRTSLEGSLLIALTLLMGWAVGRRLSPRWRYLLGWLIVVRLLLPASIPSRWSLHAALPTQPPATQAVPTIPSINLAAAPLPATEATALSPRLGEPSHTTPWFLPSTNWLPWLWLMGVVAILGVALTRLIAFSAKVRRGHPVASNQEAALLEECRKTMGIQTKLSFWVVPGLGTPALFGFWKPRILIPGDVLENLDAKELRLVFFHELAHLKAGDILLNWLVTLAGALHWFNPLAWLTIRRLRADREMVRDAQVLRLLQAHERPTYGHTLLKLASVFSGPAPCPSFLPVVQSQPETKRRIVMITRFRAESRASLAGLAVVVAVLVVTTFTRAPRVQAAGPPDGPGAAMSRIKADRDPAHASSGRQRITAKLDRIRFQETELIDGLPLSSVVEYLTAQARQRDPEKQGINFLLTLNVAGDGVTAFPTDPNTGQPIAAPAPQPVNLNDVKVSLPKLRNVRLRDLVDAIMKTAETPIQYFVEEYAVVISLKPRGTTQLHAQALRVDPNTFQQGLENVRGIPFGAMQTGAGGGQGGQSGQGDGFILPRVQVSGDSPGQGGGITGVTRTHPTQNSQEIVRDFFNSAGVNQDPASTLPRNDRTEVDALRKQIQASDRKIAAAMAKVDERKKTLDDPDGGGAPNAAARRSLDSEVVRHMFTERITAQSRLTELKTTLDALKKMSRTDLRKSITIACPGEQELPKLLARLAEVQQDMAKLTPDLGPNHAQIKSLNALLAEIERQINERLQGVMMGLEVSVQSAQARVDHHTEMMEEAKKRLEEDLKMTGNRRSYDQAVSELVDLLRAQHTINRARPGP